MRMWQNRKLTHLHLLRLYYLGINSWHCWN